MNAIPTSFAALDTIIGCGGYPQGRVVEIHGPESSGKTTLAMRAVAEVQKAGGSAFFLSGKCALPLMEQLAMSGGVDLIVVDSGLVLQDARFGALLRRIAGRHSHPSLIILNRQEEGVDVGDGPAALRYYASLRLEVRPSDGGARVKVTKNKAKPGWVEPFQEADLDIAS